MRPKPKARVQKITKTFKFNQVISQDPKGFVLFFGVKAAGLRWFLGGSLFFGSRRSSKQIL